MEKHLPSRRVSHGHSMAWHHAVTCQLECGALGSSKLERGEREA